MVAAISKPKANELLTMNRSGEFQVETNGNNHCGLSKILDIKYHMVCVCGTALDQRGFLFDQVNVDNYFKSIRKTEMSCEQLVLDCTEKLTLMIMNENPLVKIHSIDLTLSPAPFLASMTHSWKNVSKPAVRKRLGTKAIY